jgi:hypothetical protein
VLNWAGWAANFLGWGEQGAGTPTPTPTPVGGGGKRRRQELVTVTYKGQKYGFRSETEAEVFVAKLQQQAKPAPRKVAKAVAKPVEKPAAEPVVEIQAPPDMSHLRALVDAHNARRAAEHREALAAWQRESEIAQDDEEIFALLRMIDES